MIFDRLRRAAPRLRAAFKSFVRELANDPAAVVQKPEIGLDRFALAAKLSHVQCYRFELVDGDPANAKATFVNVWESLGYETPPAAASFQEAFAMVVLPEDQARAGCDVLAALSGETPTFLSEYRIRHADGSIRWNRARGIVLRDGDGKPTELLGTAVDITELKQVQEDARLLRDRMKLAVVGSNTCVWDAELAPGDFLDSKIEFTNVAEILGYEAFSHPQVWRDGLYVFPEADREAFSHGIAALLASDLRTWETTMRLIHRDRTLMTFLFRGVITRDPSGRATRLTGISMDITKYDKLAEELARTKERLELAVVGSKTAVWDIDLDRNDFLDSNAHYTNVAEMLGYDGAMFPSKWRDTLFLYHEDDRAQFVDGVAALLASDNSTWETPIRLLHRDGTVRMFLLRGVITRDSSGRATRLTGMLLDLTERNALAAELQRAEVRMKLAVIGSKTGVWDAVLDPVDFLDSTIHFTNVAEILGYEELAHPTTWRDAVYVFPEADREGFTHSIAALLASDQTTWESRLRVIHRDGTLMIFLFRGTITRDASGRATRLTGISMDITQYDKLAEELARAKDRLELAVVGSRTNVWEIEIDPDDFLESSVHYTNTAEIFGYDPATFPTKWRDTLFLYHEDERSQIVESVGGMLAGDAGGFEAPMRLLHRDGTVMTFLLRAVITRDPSGRAIRVTGMSVDITERERMEKALKEAEQRFRRVFDNAAVGMAITDPEANFIEINDRLCRFYGYPMEEAMHLRIDDRSLDGAQVEKERIRAVANGEVETMTSDKRFRRKDGQIVWHQLTASALLRDENGRATEMIGIIQNITERKTLELELLAAREAAEAANRAKDQFLAHVSHEIRTPMNAILGMTELALDCTGEHQHQLLRTARSAAGNLLDIINDLLDFSKIGAGKLSLHVADFSLRTMLADLVRALGPRAEAKGLSLHHEVGDDVPAVLRGDEGRLRQILLNLLGNAIKFTQTGEARLEVRALERTPEHATLAFDVHDTGIGIPLDRQDTIFQAFEQADATTTRNYGGTGLGLTISAQLAELMGGDIEVTSEVGRGSTFVLTVPFAVGVATATQPRRVEAARADERPLIAPRLLVAEDNEFNVAVVREILNQRGYRADYAADGRATLECLERGSYDLLLLDLHMPKLDGFGVAREVRERERKTGAHLPIIAVTARSSRNDREESLRAGMDEFLAKPIEVSALWAAVDRVFVAYPPAPRRAPLLDTETMAQVSGGRADALARLVAVFRSTLPSQLAHARAAFDDHDFHQLREAAHRLQGTLGAFSTVAAAAALGLEHAGTRSDDSRCRELLDELDHMSAELLKLFDEHPSFADAGSSS